MNINVLRSTFAAAAFLMFQGMGAGANLLTNGSLELGTFVNQGNETDTFSAGSTTITGWTTVGRQVSWINLGSPWGILPEDGNLFLDLTAYNAGSPFGGVSQAITTIAGEQYDLTYQLGSYTSAWGGPPVSIAASAGGTSATCSNTAATTSSTWTQCEMAFTATGPSTTITLTGSAGLNYIGLDNVSVVQTSSSSTTPEPGSVSLVGFGLAAAVFAMRRRASATNKL